MAETSIRRIKTFVKGLDDQIEGGIPGGTVNIISGTPGSMKSSLAYSILYHNALKIGLRGLYMSMEQDVYSIESQMERLGMDKKNDNVLLEDYKSLDKKLSSSKFQRLKFETDWIARIKAYIENLDKKKLDLLVLDSLDALYALAELENPRKELYHFFKTLRETGTTSFLISEMTQNTDQYSKHGVEEFLCDGILHLDFKRTGTILSQMERFIGIIKLRNTNYTTQYHPIHHEKGRFRILTGEDLDL